MDVLEAVKSIKDDSFQDKVQRAIACVSRTVDLYGVSGVAFSFNGGKDSTVLLHIIRAAIALPLSERTADLNGDVHGLKGICSFVFERGDDFPQILDFTNEMSRQYGLHVHKLHADFRSGVECLLETTKVKAIILGTRRGDPNANGQETFCPSSADWPPFMRVNPILDWSYADVWTFLRGTAVPYCSLYDEGYTSIGAIDNTVPNSLLRKENGTFAPAYMLADGRMERAGRINKQTPEVPVTKSLTRSAAIIVVGDELLAAKVQDVNTPFLCSQLRAIGWRVCKVVMVPDEIDAISAEVRAAANAFEIVITAGGVGPTRDDVTMAGVAEALGKPLSGDSGLEIRLRNYFGSDITAAHLKMAEAPQGACTVIDYMRDDGSASPFPLIKCNNVYVLPGVPDLLRSKWKVAREQLLAEGELMPFHTVVLRLPVSDETRIAPALDKVARALGRQVSIGSYPMTKQKDGAGILLSLESKDMKQLTCAQQLLNDALPSDARATSVEYDSPVFGRGTTPRSSIDVARE
ncbi:hypothetical protein ABBQ32_012130 [Trebouxia sp. C0010 RCD-2024]